jgi:serine/threonine-protein kinase HipA
LRAVTASPAFGAGADPGGNFRISIAGAQEKTALLYMGGVWHRPLNATPTTHILKLPLGIIGNFRGDFSHSVENEWLCSQFLRELGLPVAETQIAAFGEQRVLAVKRFDRRWMGVDQSVAEASGYVPAAGTWIARLPQEDFCQATGRPPTKRYENEGGPSANEILDILANSESAPFDRANFLMALLAFWLLAATDGHGKNFSIHLQAGSKFALAPLYDVLSAWPVIRHGANKLALQDVKLAMAVSGRDRHYKLMEIQARHWHAAALRVGGPELWNRMKATVASAEAAVARINAILPKRFPDIVITTIANGLRRQAQRFAIGERSL